MSDSVLYPQIVWFGDSFFEDFNKENGLAFQCWLISLSNRRCDIVVRGQSGWNTTQALWALPNIIRPPGPDIPNVIGFVVCFGANDAAIQKTKNSPHVPLETFVKNMRSIIEHANVQAHKPKIFVVVPPPVNERVRTPWDKEKHGEKIRDAEQAKRYSDAVRNLAGDLGQDVVVIDLYDIIIGLSTEKNIDRLLPDGLHMSSESYGAFKDEVEKPMQELITKLTYVLPSWDDPTWEAKLSLSSPS